VTVTLEGDQLMLQELTRKNPLFAESEGHFFRRLPDSDADIEFVKDDKGAVTHFLLFWGQDAFMISDPGGVVVEVREWWRWTRVEAQAKPRGGAFPQAITNTNHDACVS
jgi:hypothetical protein